MEKLTEINTFPSQKYNVTFLIRLGFPSQKYNVTFLIRLGFPSQIYNVTFLIRLGIPSQKNNVTFLIRLGFLSQKYNVTFLIRLGFPSQKYNVIFLIRLGFMSQKYNVTFLIRLRFQVSCRKSSIKITLTFFILLRINPFSEFYFYFSFFGLLKVASSFDIIYEYFYFKNIFSLIFLLFRREQDLFWCEPRSTKIFSSPPYRLLKVSYLGILELILLDFLGFNTKIWYWGKTGQIQYSLNSGRFKGLFFLI